MKILPSLANESLDAVGAITSAITTQFPSMLKIIMVRGRDDTLYLYVCKYKDLYTNKHTYICSILCPYTSNCLVY